MNKRNTIILGLLFVILMVQIIVLAPKNAGEPPEPDDSQVHGEQKPKMTDTGGQVIQNLHLVQAKPDGKEWELWADQASRPKDTERWSIEKVRVKFFADDGVLYTVTGKRGSVVPQKNDMRIEGDVVTRSSNGYTFKTDSVFYDSLVRRLTSPHAVEMVGPKDDAPGATELSRLHLTGEDLVADMSSNQITIGRHVKAKKGVTGVPSTAISTPGSKQTSKDAGQTSAAKDTKAEKIATIQSRRAVFSGRSNMAHFYGDVVMDMDTMRITGPEARFAYDPKQGNLTSVEVEGGVKVTDTDKFATSKSVSVEFEGERVVFKGAPRVVQNGDELVGDEIVFLDGGKKVQVSNAKAQIDPNSVEKKN